MDRVGATEKQSWSRRTAVCAALTLLATGNGASRTSAQDSAPSRCPVPQDDPTVLVSGCVNFERAFTGISASLNARADALERDDRDAFLATLDLRNPTWRRIQSEYFDSRHGQRNVVLRGTPIALHAKPGGYVRATVAFARDGSPPTERGAWVFSSDSEGIWHHAEPTNEELGPRLLDDRGDFVLSYYEWDADVLDRVAEVARSAWTTVGAILPLPTSVRPTISLNPTYGSHSGLRGANTWAAYLPGTKGIVLLRSPESYGAGTVPINSTPDPKLLVPLTHEMTHLVNDDIVSIVRIPEWMSEGLAEHVADHMRAGELAGVVRSGRTWTLDKVNDVIEWGLDAARNYSSADVSLAYAHAAHGVRYYVERFGLERFWSLAREYATSRTWDLTFQQVTGVSWATFGTDWTSWLQARFP